MMKKMINKFLIIGSLILIILGQKTAFCEQVPMDQYKQDYLQACKLIANKYIYLEQKLGISRTDFYQQCVTYADTVDWCPGKPQFVREIRKLRSKFNDGHFDWELDKQFSSILNIQKDYRVYKETIAVKTGNKHSFMINFSEEVAESYDLDFKNIWRGKTILRINSICGSCCDFFARWFQLNKRGQIIGFPSAGRWGDCNTYTLKNTKTKIEFPFGNEYSSEDKSMEGIGVKPDDITDDTLDSALEKLIGNN